MERISKYISYKEATQSQTATRKGIDNTPTEEHLKNMKFLGEKIFDPIREHFGVPLTVSSFYRSATLNKSIGGASTSQHTRGEAIDVDHDTLNFQIFEWVRENLDFVIGSEF